MATAPSPRNRRPKPDHATGAPQCTLVPKVPSAQNAERHTSAAIVMPRMHLRLQWKERVAMVAVLAVSAIVITHGIRTGEFSFNVDETIHATTGLYFADFVRDLPLRNLLQYTYRYYGQYPALGIVHWPPLFHMSEGVAFLLFGPSVVVARMTVVLFALLGIYFEFRLVQSVVNTRTAFI